MRAGRPLELRVLKALFPKPHNLRGAVSVAGFDAPIAGGFWAPTDIELSHSPLNSREK